MSERDVIEKIQAMDRALSARGMSSEASERVRQNLAREAAGRPFAVRMRWWPVVAFAAGAALMAVLLLDRADREREVAERDETPAIVEERPAIVEERPIAPESMCEAFAPGSRRLEAGDCVQGDGIEVSALIPSTIQREGDRVVVEQGEVVFEVESRPDNPLHVIAGAIDIEVVGTRFVVYQREGEGWVSMLEGRVRVREGEDEGVMLERGMRFEWSAAIEAEPSAAKANPREPKVQPADQGLAELLDEVATLRREGRFQDAVDRLRAADSRTFSERSRQLVSYEIGTLLERQLRDVEAACEHWLEHRERFPGGRHDEIVERSIERLGCNQ
jgi:ferric-dicitrate binding protein FerR (iron transport regulator)